MGSLKAPRGLIVNLITPLRNNGSIDGTGLGRLLDRMSTRVHGIFLASPGMGEGKNLSVAQRIELLEKSLVVIRGRTPILIWVTQPTEEETKDTIFSLKKVLKKRRGSNHIFWVDTPLYYHSNRGLPSYFRDLYEEVDEPLILHNDPKLIEELAKPLKRNNIRTAVLKELVEIKNVIGLIFLGSMERVRNYERACRSRPDFRIYDGEETRFMDHPSTSGVVSAGANLAPRAWQRITESSLQLEGSQKIYPDSLKQVWELGRYLRDLREIYQDMPVPLVKDALFHMGVIETPDCTYKTEKITEQREKIRELMLLLGDYPEKNS